MNRYSDPRYVTSSEDLKNILARCKKCYKLTLQASLILPIESLGEMMLPKNHQKKFYAIVHVKSKQSSLGHWISLSCYLTEKKAVIIDPSNKYRFSNSTVHYIRLFCQKNHLSEINYAVQLQSPHSLACGQICVAMCGKTHNSSIQQILNVRKLIKTYSVAFNEHHLISYAKKHFAISF